MTREGDNPMAQSLFSIPKELRQLIDMVVRGDEIQPGSGQPAPYIPLYPRNSSVRPAQTPARAPGPSQGESLADGEGTSREGRSEFQAEIDAFMAQAQSLEPRRTGVSPEEGAGSHEGMAGTQGRAEKTGQPAADDHYAGGSDQRTPLSRYLQREIPSIIRMQPLTAAGGFLYSEILGAPRCRRRGQRR